MKTVGFIGAFEKADLLMNIAKMLTVAGQRVLLVDSTINQKARYIVPVIRATKSYITSFEQFDIAVGFEKKQDIKDYLGVSDDEELEYDIILVDVDSSEVFKEYDLKNANFNYFVTSFDLYSLRKGLEIISGIEDNIRMSKILFSKDMAGEEKEYLEFLLEKYNIAWNKGQIYFPFAQGDESIHAENQRVARLKIRNLSTEFKENLLVVAEEILEDISINDLKKLLKSVERGV